jgi:uncharacterized protein (TIGR01244 family)
MISLIKAIFKLTVSAPPTPSSGSRESETRRCTFVFQSQLYESPSMSRRQFLNFLKGGAIATTALVYPGALSFNSQNHTHQRGINMENAIKINNELAVKSQLTPEEFDLLAGAGFKSVLNLRSPDEQGFLPDEQQYASAAGLEYLNTPVEPGKINHQLVNQLMQDIDNLPKPILIHCSKGMRAGLIGLIYIATREGMTPEQALETGKLLGLNFDSQPQFKQVLESEICDRQQVC